MNLRHYISQDPNICHGKPCFKETRIPVYLVLELLEAGYTTDYILTKCYPELNKKAIQAALHYAADLTRNREYVAFASS